ncbi:MAG: transaldolase [Trueperaceae bacterium]|nr:transaldolase [Trueperaceae bacterium]
MNPLRRLAALGQSVYLDAISRPMIEGGDLRRLIEEDDLQGVTSNPAIFEKAIAQSADYDDAIAELAGRGMPSAEIFETLAVEDIRAAADLFAASHQASDGQHGYVSLEVSPLLADDTDGTIAEARRLWRALDRANVFVKVPGTKAGLPAVRRLTALGINVNVTLLFGLPRYQAVAEAYIAGLEDRLAAGESVSGVASVASFFLSRIDVLIDPRLDELVRAGGDRGERAAALRGTAAIASAKRAFVIYTSLFGGDRFAPLAAAGARPQRLLWASTGVKDPAYHDLAYVEPLIGADTVTTLPQETLDAYRDHGDPRPRLTDELDEAEAKLRALGELGIDLDAATVALEREGVEKFVTPFESLMQAIDEARERTGTSAGGRH